MSLSGGAAVDVDVFMRSNRRPRHAAVQGVVARVDAPKQMMALIDKAEYEKCSTTACAALYLPVRWEGTMPAENEIVVARGEVVAEGGKLVFLANAIEKLPPATQKVSE